MFRRYLTFVITLTIAFLVSATPTLAQRLPGTGHAASNDTKGKIITPNREARLKALLPIIRGLYNNTETYSRHNTIQNGYADIEYRERTKKPAEDVITLQLLKDFTEVIDYIKYRDVQSSSSEHYQKNDPNYPFGRFFLFRKQTKSIFTTLPEHINIVVEPDAQGCFNFCRAVLLRGDVKSVTIIETEKDSEHTTIFENGAPRFINATRYALDKTDCMHLEKPLKNEHFGRSDLNQNTNNNLYGTDNRTDARPAFSLCFKYETVKVPETGMFFYTNSTSPLWPDAFERKRMRTKTVKVDPPKHKPGELPRHHIPSYEKPIFPKSFETLETSFEVGAINHLAVEHRKLDNTSQPEIIHEEACILGISELSQQALDILLSTYEPPKDKLYRRRPDGSETASIPSGRTTMITANNKNVLCYGDRPYYTKNYRVRISSIFPPEYDAYDPWVSLPESEIITRLNKAYERYTKTGSEFHLSTFYNELKNNPPLTENLAAGLFPIYKGFILKHDDWRFVSLLEQFPEGSLSGHVKGLNKIRDHILDKSGCKTLYCNFSYARQYNSSKIRIITLDKENPWLRVAANGAGIYAAAGPKAIKPLETGHKKGLGGAVYAMGCMRANNEAIEKHGIQALARQKISAQNKARHYMSMRFSKHAEDFKTKLANDSKVKRFYDLSESLLPDWESEKSMCVYRNEM